MPEAFIIDAVRTPRGIGKPGKGALAHLHPQHLGATVLAALRDRNGLDTATIDDIVWSTSSQKGHQGGDMGRMAALTAGFDTSVSGTTLDRFCGGGITSVALAAASVMAGMEDCLIGGGCEMMSYTASLAAQESEAGIAPMRMGAGNATLDALHPQSHQGVCADAIAAMEGMGRDVLDALAVESQRRAGQALAEGRFARSIVPVMNEDGSLALDHDELPRPDTTLETMASLKPAFAGVSALDLGAGETYGDKIRRRFPDLQWEPVHHAGNSSGVVDGAAAVLICSGEHAKRHGLTPRARIVAYANMGGDPTLMLNAPVPAARKALQRAGLTKNDIDVWEINEAFAVVAEKFMRDLDLDRSKVNINGGAIALGHPIGATGSMLIGTAIDELERSGGRFGLVTMCAAGGMAPAIVLERL